MSEGRPERGGIFEFLKKVPLFADLPKDDLLRLCREVSELELAAGQELFAEGSAGDEAYVIKDGELEVLKESAGREVLLAVRERGEVIGEMALLEESPRMAGVSARTDSVLIAIHKEQMDRLLETSTSAAAAMFNAILGRWRATESMLRQSEKMAQLGTLTAGVAHELNNPAAAVKRGADQLEAAVAQAMEAQTGVDELALTNAQRETLEARLQRAREQAVRPAELDALARSDREYELEEWLEERDVEDAWELAPTLANLDYDTSDLAALADAFQPEQLPAVIGLVEATYSSVNLMTEIGQGAGRISDIVKALKSYSYLDQAPVQEVDIHEGIDNTLLILRNKLIAGINVRREYAPNLPTIQAYGSELNQVWTNLIDNAADALDGEGQIRHPHGPGRRQDTGRDRRQRPRYPGRDSVEDFRLVLYHETAGQGDGSGPGHQLQHRRSKAQRRHQANLGTRPDVLQGLAPFDVGSRLTSPLDGGRLEPALSKTPIHRGVGRRDEGNADLESAFTNGWRPASEGG